MKVGAIRWRATIDEETGKVEIDEWVLRSMSRRKKFSGIVWYGEPQMVHYWRLKADGITWGKRSKKRGDYGWLDPIPHYCREDCLSHRSPPYSATKTGALRSLLADLRRCQKAYGDFDPDWPDELPYSVQIKKVQARISRENSKK